MVFRKLIKYSELLHFIADIQVPHCKMLIDIIKPKVEIRNGNIYLKV